MIDLLEHLLAEYWGHRQPNERPQLMPAGLPAQLPVQVPIPDESRLVGSVVWQDATMVVFDCTLTVRQELKETLLTLRRAAESASVEEHD